MFNLAVTNNPVVSADPNLRNAVHVFIAGASFRPATAQAPECLSYDGGGYTFFHCGQFGERVGMVIFGTFYSNHYNNTGQSPDGIAWTAAPPAPENIPYGGNIILSEFLHMVSVDHPFGTSHLDGGDQCNDTPAFQETPNNMMQTFYQQQLLHPSLRCALTECQLGRMHHFFEELNPIWVRTEENGFIHPPVTQFCDLSQPDIVIPAGANVVWDRARNIRSNIVVEPGGKLTIKCDVGLPKDARINVGRNGELHIIEGARLYNNCAGDRWEGIIVAGNSTMHQFKVSGVRYQGFVFLDNGATIEGANIGIRNYHPAYDQWTGGIIVAEDAIFKNNIVAIDFAPYQNYNFLYGTPQNDMSDFSRCQFIVDEDFGPDYASFLSMASLRGVTGIPFKACVFANDYPTAQLDYSYEKQYGIRATNAGFQVTGICLSNPPCTNYEPSEFRGFGTAIYAGNYVGVRTFQVSNTNFNHNGKGIVAYRVDNIYAVNNHFLVGSSLPGQYDTPFIGVEIYRGTGYKVEENLFESSAQISGPAETIGVFVNHSGDEPNTIYKNGLRGVDYGNLSNGKNRGILEDEGLRYQCNNNVGNGFDFAVPAENYGIVGIAEFQGASTQAAGNTFSQVLPSSQPEMHFLNQAAPLTYYWQPGSSYLPTNYSTLTISLPSFASSANQCPSKLPSGKENGGLSELEIQAYEQAFANSSEATVKAEAANMLVRNYLIDEDGPQLPAVKTWLANKGSLGARFAIVDAELQEGNVSGTQQALASLPPLVHPPTELQAEYTHFNALKGIQINALQTGLSESQMMSAHFLQIKTIAEAGDYYASVQAQVMLNALAGTDYHPDVILPSSGQQNLAAPPAFGNTLNAEAANLQAVPNPAVQEAIFHYRLSEGIEQAQIMITSADGRVVERISVGTEKSQIPWSTENCKSGVYFYYLVVEAKTMLSGRLVVIK